MEMSLDYMEKAVAFFETAKYALTRSERVYGTFGGKEVCARVYTLVRSANERLVFECVTHPEKGALYYLAFDHHGMSSFSVRIDSWKVHATWVEVRFYLSADGTGLSFKFVP
jgi:hypothetical protein